MLAELPDATVEFGLDLGFPKAGEVGLKSLVQLMSLRWLNLNRTKVTVSNLQDLSALHNLQGLSLLDSDAGSVESLNELANLKNLRHLNLSFNEATDDGLRELANLEKLQSLNLQENNVHAAGVKHLVGLVNCKRTANPFLPVSIVLIPV